MEMEGERGVMEMEGERGVMEIEGERGERYGDCIIVYI